MDLSFYNIGRLEVPAHNVFTIFAGMDVPSRSPSTLRLVGYENSQELFIVSSQALAPLTQRD
jgi:hypothetical protein